MVSSVIIFIDCYICIMICVKCICELKSYYADEGELIYSIVLLYLKRYNAFYIEMRSHSYFDDFRLRLAAQESVRMACRVVSYYYPHVSVMLW